MGRLKNYENKVIEVLSVHPDARENDRRLYLYLLENMGYNTNITIEEFFSTDDYPNLESIRRVRQKCQEKYPELRPSMDIYLRRNHINTAEYLEYVRED